MLGLIEIEPRRCGPSPGRLVKLGSSSSARFTLPEEPRILNRFTAAGLLREVAVDSKRSYFDTNTTNHHHFFNQDTAELTDIPGDSVIVDSLPDSPGGAVIDGVDVIVRLRNV